MNYADIINKNALKYSLRPDVVACIILQESAGDTFATRFEKEFYEVALSQKSRYQLSGWIPKQNETPTIDTEKVARATSYGLMQVLGDTARWCGGLSSKYLTVLCDPEIGVNIGCKVLRYYLDMEKNDYAKALCRYNAGSVKSPAGQAYAVKIMDRLSKNEHLKILR